MKLNFATQLDFFTLLAKTGGLHQVILTISVGMSARSRKLDKISAALFVKVTARPVPDIGPSAHQCIFLREPGLEQLKVKVNRDRIFQNRAFLKMYYCNQGKSKISSRLLHFGNASSAVTALLAIVMEAFQRCVRTSIVRENLAKQTVDQGSGGLYP